MNVTMIIARNIRVCFKYDAQRGASYLNVW